MYWSHNGRNKLGYVCVVYRPPNAPANLLDSLNNMVGNIVTQVNNDAIILGDFNCDMSPSKRDNSSNSLQSIMSGLLLFFINSKIFPPEKLFHPNL